MPSIPNVTRLFSGAGVSSPVIALNVFAMALWTLGVFASLYAGYLKPELRVTCSNLSSVINGVATIMMFVFIDPQVSLMTDDVVGRAALGRKIPSSNYLINWGSLRGHSARAVPLGSLGHHHYVDRRIDLVRASESSGC